MAKLNLPWVDEVDHGWQVITTAGDIDEVEYDDSADHDPCPDCNPSGKSPCAGWYYPLSRPRERCLTCEGAGWI